MRPKRCRLVTLMGRGQNWALQAYAEGLRAQVGQDEVTVCLHEWTCGSGRPRWTRSPEEAKWTDGPAARGFGPEEADLHSIWPKPRFSARERGFGPELLHLAQSQVFGSRKGVCLRGRTYGLVFASTGPNPGLRLEKAGLGQKS